MSVAWINFASDLGEYCGPHESWEKPVDSNAYFPVCLGVLIVNNLLPVFSGDVP